MAGLLVFEYIVGIVDLHFHVHVESKILLLAPSPTCSGPRPEKSCAESTQAFWSRNKLHPAIGAGALKSCVIPNKRTHSVISLRACMHVQACMYGGSRSDSRCTHPPTQRNVENWRVLRPTSIGRQKNASQSSPRRPGALAHAPASPPKLRHKSLGQAMSVIGSWVGEVLGPIRVGDTKFTALSYFRGT